MKSPTNKDELRSILGLLSWYSSRAKLRDCTRRMRELAKNQIKFKWDDELESDLRESIEVLLDPISGCLRAPIAPTKEHCFVLFTDSSRHAFGGVLAQIQRVGEMEIKNEGLHPNTKRMYLIEYYSKSIPDNQKLTPIALLELESLYLCLR